MRITRCDNYDEMSRRAAQRVVDEIAAKPDLAFCAATGNSPSGLYQGLSRRYGADPALFARLRVIKLDEWLGVAPDDPVSCEHYLRNRLLDPLQIAPQRYVGFDSTAADASAETKRIQVAIERGGGIDVCILGLGVNGHVALNEPADWLSPHCHIAELAATTSQHGLLSGTGGKVRYGLTLGVADILNARKIVLLVAGNGKEQATAALLDGKVTTRMPVTFLLLHPDVEVFLDR
jgi:galactosamine-6-phosphate isomerase